ncbi:hypothetical protein Z517_02409 [Fonsecaea pedrosoi CBS 271.37]|uniref:Major facilitator superfamily (MFS) profile domain-containing protein n=1 Tax=Fonsecaea pedrosoi CBS 271.37 TaxID=1442368 RepID=A0A0D2GX03_9EURO|nr:uncharacterized protein Z517_02409 [Fonsecaea pedrosoi CBS 271.37]KIW83165.1 hypothetical protein Z517_02409 [Fonsecaea pedrosoi CBS 271.37]
MAGEEKHTIHAEDVPVNTTAHLAHDDQEIEMDNGEILLRLTPGAEKGSGVNNLKLAKDGQTVLIPQPSDDPDDPLNWSSFKKHMILICVAFGAFAGDFGSGAGVGTIVVQGIEWNMSPVVVNYAGNLNVIMCGVSGLIWMPLLNYWGRTPVLFWSSVMGAAFTLGSALAPNFAAFYGFRTLQGVTQSTGQTIGLAFIHDMFFFHEHARKIGVWYAIYIISPFVGPFCGNFIVGTLGEWRPVFWLVFAWSCFLLCLTLMFGDETYYKRSVPPSQQPPRPGGQLGRLSRVLGVWQIQHHGNGYFSTLPRCYGRLGEVLLKPVIPLSMLFYLMIFMWSVGINITSSILLQTPVEAGGYGFSSIACGYMYFTPFVAILIGEAFGHYFNDWIAARYVTRHHGLFVPETRLWTNYIGGVFMVPGLVLVGEALQRHWHWVAIVFGWGMFQFGVMVVSVATVAYVLDCYPSASGEVSALLNFARVLGGFTVGYFQQSWGLKMGFDVSFGLQAVIVVAAYVILVFVQVYGARLRRWSGPVRITL